MPVDLSALTLLVSKPRGKVARGLAELGIQIAPADDPEENVDRYVVSRRLAIERRTGSGFLMGVMDKTLFTSAIYLREHFTIPILIVEGDINYEYTAFDPQAVRGALSSMMLQYGLSVLSTHDVEETVALITMMARQEQIGIPEISLVPKRTAGDVPDMQRRVVEMLPGCGRVMARELLRRFGSVRRVMNADKDELREMRGLGARKVETITKVLASDYEAVDTEKDIEDAIEATPGMLFKRAVDRLARQHYIFSDAGDRHVIDLVFRERASGDIVLVELKRGKLTAGDVRQLVRYLDHARESAMLRSLMDQGAGLKGILASIEPSDIDPARADITVQQVDRKRVIRALKAVRKARVT